MYDGRIKGMFAVGMNGVQIGPDTRKNIEALKKADWLVVGEIYPDETSEFWRAPGTTPEEIKKIKTTVYRCHAPASPRRTEFSQLRTGGCSGRSALPMPLMTARSGHPRADLHEGRELSAEGGQFPALSSTCVAVYEPFHPAWPRCARDQRAGYQRRHGSGDGQIIRPPAQSFAFLRDDGSTLLRQLDLSGSWTEQATRWPARHRGSVGPRICANWAWSWPANARPLHRASCDPSGKPGTQTPPGVCGTKPPGRGSE